MAKPNIEQGVDNEDREQERKRLQIEFSPDALERLNNLRREADARSNAEVVRNALRLYEWFIHQKNQGARLQVVKGETVREVELVF